MTLGRLALVLPVCSLALLWALVSVHRSRLGLGRLSARGTLVMAFVAFEVALVLTTELLSLGHALTPGRLTLAWAVITAVTAVAVVRTGCLAAARRWTAGGGWGRTRRAVTDRPVVLLGVVALVLIGVALVLTAWWFLPNNSDSLAYHLTRVAHWVQDRSVEHFATHYLAQVQLAPGQEYNMLHLHLLAGTDRLDGLPQLAAFVVCVVGGAEIARLLGGRAEVQVLTAVIAAATPSLVLEATSTQNNLFAASFALAVVVLILAWTPDDPPVLMGLWLGAGLGLMVFAKGTTIPLIVPVALALGLRLAVIEAAKSSWATTARRLLVAAGVAGALVLVLNGPFQLRNAEVSGTTSGPIAGTLNDEVSPRATAGNVLRNVALQFRIGDGTSGIDTDTSRFVLPKLRRAYGWTGEPLNSGHSDYGFGADAFELKDYSPFERNEDYGASPWFVLLLAACFPIIIVRAVRGDGSQRAAALLAIAGAAGFVVFSATTKWTPYGARYLLPLMVLGPPLIALTLAGVHRYLLRAVAVVLVVAGLPALLDSWARPLLDRPVTTNDLDAYVVRRPPGDPFLATAADYVAVRDAVVASGCTRVGVGNWMLFEYLLWAGLDHAGWKGEIEHIGSFDNETRTLVDQDFKPCAIVQDRAWIGPLLPHQEGMVDTTYGGLVLSVEG